MKEQKFAAEKAQALASEMVKFGNDFMGVIERRQATLAEASEATGGDGISVVSTMMSVISDIMWQATIEQFVPGTPYDAMRQVYVAMWYQNASLAVDRTATRPPGTTAQ